MAVVPRNLLSIFTVPSDKKTLGNTDLDHLDATDTNVQGLQTHLGKLQLTQAP